MSFLELKGKTFLVVGVANRKSVAFSVAQLLEQEGATVIYSVRSQTGYFTQLPLPITQKV